MNTKLFKSKFVCWVLIVLLTLQSCTAYKKTPISISEASESNEKMLIVTIANKRIPVKKIEKMDSIYYGFKKIKGQEVKIPLKESEIKAIRPINPTKSTIGTVGIIVSVTLALFLAVLINDFNNSWGSFDMGEEN